MSRRASAAADEPELTPAARAALAKRAALLDLALSTGRLAKDKVSAV